MSFLIKKTRGSKSQLFYLAFEYLSKKPKIASSLSPPFFTATVIASPPTSPPFRQIPNHSVFLSSSTVHLGLTVLQTFRWNLVCFESISVAKALDQLIPRSLRLATPITNSLLSWILLYQCALFLSIFALNFLLRLKVSGFKSS